MPELQDLGMIDAGLVEVGKQGVAAGDLLEGAELASVFNDDVGNDHTTTTGARRNELGQAGSSVRLGHDRGYDAFEGDPSPDFGNFDRLYQDPDCGNAINVLMPSVRRESAYAFVPPPLSPADCEKTSKRSRENDWEPKSDDEESNPPSPPAQPVREPSVADGKSLMSPEMLSATFNEIAERLKINDRGERDWDGVYKRLAAEFDWLNEVFEGKRTLFKQKMKLLLQERRMRPQLGFWKKLKALSIKSPCAEAELAGQITSSVCAVFPTAVWDFTLIARYLLDRVQKNESNPGAVVEWPAGPRNDMIAKLLDLHVAAGYTFYKVWECFKGIFVPSEVEMAILSACRCEHCIRWGLQEFPDWSNEIIIAEDPNLLRNFWTRRRAEIMRDLVDEHMSLRTVDEALDSVHASSGALSLITHWGRDDIATLLMSSHTEKICAICQGSKRPRRAAGDGESDSNSFTLIAPSLDQAEDELAEDDGESDDSGLTEALGGLSINP